MEFRIADTFTASLARLTGEEQKAVKTTAFDLQINPASPGMNLHKVERAKDKNFWSVRAGSDIRLIVHRTEGSLLLCFVDHHDKAYEWAERRKLETHPRTGAAQLVEIRETVQEIVIPAAIQAPTRRSAMPSPIALYASFTNDDLLGFGVPVEWIDDVRGATADTILGIADHLPAEASEALLDIATGGTPRVSRIAVPVANPFNHPDAQRRFRVMANVEELEQALEFPWDKWTIFLHPEQRQMVEREYAGPARVSGSAGTGKTIVALHRAAYIARRNHDARVLLTTFSSVLANDLAARIKRLVYHEPMLSERIDVYSIDAIATRLYTAQFGAPKFATDADIRAMLADASGKAVAHRFSPGFLKSEWDQIVDAWQLESWEAYRDVARLGRKTRLPEAQRVVLWSIFESVWQGFAERDLITRAGMLARLTEALGRRAHLPFDYVVVDEAQDVGVAEMRFLVALGAGRADALFFTGDSGQRIFQQAFSWKALGVDIRGRSRTLRVNYRTSHQIRAQADRLLGAEVSDADGITEKRTGTVSVFNGPSPKVRAFPDEQAEIDFVAGWLSERKGDGVAPQEIGVFVRSGQEIDRAKKAIEASGLLYEVLTEGVESRGNCAALCVMHLAKGLEFRAVVVMACDDEVIPSQERIETVTDESDLEEVYNTERHLLYVACTRARDYLLVTSVEPPSEFLDDLRA